MPAKCSARRSVPEFFPEPILLDFQAFCERPFVHSGVRSLIIMKPNAAAAQKRETPERPPSCPFLSVRYSLKCQILHSNAEWFKCGMRNGYRSCCGSIRFRFISFPFHGNESGRVKCKEMNGGFSYTEALNDGTTCSLSGPKSSPGNAFVEMENWHFAGFRADHLARKRPEIPAKSNPEIFPDSIRNRLGRNRNGLQRLRSKQAKRELGDAAPMQSQLDLSDKTGHSNAECRMQAMNLQSQRGAFRFGRSDDQNV
jgi:hypothetical protein